MKLNILLFLSFTALLNASLSCDQKDNYLTLKSECFNFLRFPPEIIQKIVSDPKPFRLTNKTLYLKFTNTILTLPGTFKPTKLEETLPLLKASHTLDLYQLTDDAYIKFGFNFKNKIPTDSYSSISQLLSINSQPIQKLILREDVIIPDMLSEFIKNQNIKIKRRSYTSKSALFFKENYFKSSEIKILIDYFTDLNHGGDPTFIFGNLFETDHHNIPYYNHKSIDRKNDFITLKSLRKILYFYGLIYKNPQGRRTLKNLSHKQHIRISLEQNREHPQLIDSIILACNNPKFDFNQIYSIFKKKIILHEYALQYHYLSQENGFMIFNLIDQHITWPSKPKSELIVKSRTYDNPVSSLTLLTGPILLALTNFPESEQLEILNRTLNLYNFNKNMNPEIYRNHFNLGELFRSIFFTIKKTLSLPRALFYERLFQLDVLQIKYNFERKNDRDRFLEDILSLIDTPIFRNN